MGHDVRKPEVIPTNHPDNNNVATGVVSRRALLRAAAWTLPAVAVAVGTPALAASPPDGGNVPVSENIFWYWSQFQVGSRDNRDMRIFTQMNLEIFGEVQPFTAFMTIHFEAYRDREMTQLFHDHTDTFTYAFNGTNGETTPDGLIGFVRVLSPEELPPPGGPIWVRFTMMSVSGVDGSGNEFSIAVSPHSEPNPSVGTGHISSW